MKLDELFVNHKQVEPISFVKDIPELPKNIYLNLDRAQKATSDKPEDTSTQKIEKDNSSYDWKVGYGKPNTSDYYTRLREFIVKEEGFRERAYRDGKYWSIGYGFNDPKYKEGDFMSREEADKELDRQLQTREAKYKKRFGAKWDNLSDNQRIALMSYGYNTGDGNIIGGNVAKYLDLGDMDNLRESLSINTAGGQYNSVLDARRRRERELFNS